MVRITLPRIVVGLESCRPKRLGGGGANPTGFVVVTPPALDPLTGVIDTPLTQNQRETAQVPYSGKAVEGRRSVGEREIALDLAVLGQGLVILDIPGLNRHFPIVRHL